MGRLGPLDPLGKPPHLEGGRVQRGQRPPPEKPGEDRGVPQQVDRGTVFEYQSPQHVASKIIESANAYIDNAHDWEAAARQGAQVAATR